MSSYYSWLAIEPMRLDGIGGDLWVSGYGLGSREQISLTGAHGQSVGSCNCNSYACRHVSMISKDQIARLSVFQFEKEHFQ